MFTAKVFNVMIGGLSGTMEEVYVAKETIHKWNQANAENRDQLFMPVEWSAKSEDLNNADVVIGIIDNWIDDYASVEACIQNQKKVILFFKANRDPANTMSSEISAVSTFRDRMQGKCSCIDYCGVHDIVKTLEDWIDVLIQQ